MVRKAADLSQARRTSDGQIFTLRLPCNDTGGRNRVSLRKDYEFSSMLNHKSIGKVFDWLQNGTLVLEPLECIHTTPANIMPIGSFFKMSIQISKALAYVHDSNIIHNAIHPR